MSTDVNKVFIYTFFDLYSFWFAILLAMLVGNVFQPNLAVFLIIFLVTSGALYYYWFKKFSREVIQWVRIIIHVGLLLTTLPILIGISGLIFKVSSNTVFWLAIVPVFVLLTSFLFHNIYRISP